MGASSRFQAERKAGGLLEEMGLGHHGGDRRSSSSLELETVGLTKKESHRFQLLAKVPEYEKALRLVERRRGVLLGVDLRQGQRTDLELPTCVSEVHPKTASRYRKIARYWDVCLFGYLTPAALDERLGRSILNVGAVFGGVVVGSWVFGRSILNAVVQVPVHRRDTHPQRLGSRRSYVRDDVPKAP